MARPVPAPSVNDTRQHWLARSVQTTLLVAVAAAFLASAIGLYLVQSWTAETRARAMASKRRASVVHVSLGPEPWTEEDRMRQC